MWSIFYISNLEPSPGRWVVFLAGSTRQGYDSVKRPDRHAQCIYASWRGNKRLCSCAYWKHGQFKYVFITGVMSCLLQPLMGKQTGTAPTVVKRNLRQFTFMTCRQHWGPELPLTKREQLHYWSEKENNNPANNTAVWSAKHLAGTGRPSLFAVLRLPFVAQPGFDRGIWRQYPCQPQF